MIIEPRLKLHRVEFYGTWPGNSLKSPWIQCLRRCGNPGGRKKSRRKSKQDRSGYMFRSTGQTTRVKACRWNHHRLPTIYLTVLYSTFPFTWYSCQHNSWESFPAPVRLTLWPSSSTIRPRDSPPLIKGISGHSLISFITQQLNTNTVTDSSHRGSEAGR